MKKNVSRILIIVGQSLMLLYFIGLTFQTLLLMSNLIQSFEQQFANVLNFLFIFSILTVVSLTIALVNSCLKTSRFWKKRGGVTLWNACSVGFAIFGLSVITSYPAYLFTGMLWYVLFASGYVLSFLAFRAYYKKRMQALDIEKSSLPPKVKLAQFQKLFEQGYLADEEMKAATKEFTAKS